MHKGEKLPLNGEGLDLRIYPKTSNEIVNDHLDNNKDLYDDDTFNRLKRKASGDEVPEPYNFLPKRDKPPREDPSINCSLCSATFLNERDRVITWQIFIQHVWIVENNLQVERSTTNMNTPDPTARYVKEHL